MLRLALVERDSEGWNWPSNCQIQNGRKHAQKRSTMVKIRYSTFREIRPQRRTINEMEISLWETPYNCQLLKLIKSLAKCYLLDCRFSYSINCVLVDHQTTHRLAQFTDNLRDVCCLLKSQNYNIRLKNTSAKVLNLCFSNKGVHRFWYFVFLHSVKWECIALWRQMSAGSANIWPVWQYNKLFFNFEKSIIAFVIQSDKKLITG